MRKLILGSLAATAIAVAVFWIPPRVWLSVLMPSELHKVSHEAMASPGATSTAPVLESPKIVSRAPWSELRPRFAAGEYSALIASARAAPHLGSYSYALEALGQCAEISFHGTEAEQVRRLEESLRSDDPQRAIRLTAIRKLFEPCRGLGNFADISRARDELSKEMRARYDARNAMFERAYGLAQQGGNLEERTRIFRELVDLHDGDAASALKGAVAGPGALYAGQELGARERMAIGVAWDMAVCEVYGKCLVADSRQNLLLCATKGACDFRSGADLVQEYAPYFLAGDISGYRTKIVAGFRTGNMGDFGPQLHR